MTVESGTTVDPISATRDISDQTVEAGSTFTVTLTLTANEDIQAPTLDEALPTGWTVTEVDNGGATYKAATTEWVWTTAMPSGETKTVIYDVTVPAGTTPQDYDITGQASAYEVSPVTIGGESTVTVGTASPAPSPSPAPPTPSTEVPVMTTSGICAFIGTMCFIGAGRVIKKGRRS